jgi:hypothetical protein
MARSRSSFELDSAIATATSLHQSDPPSSAGPHYAGVKLVSFKQGGTPRTVPPTPPEPPAPLTTRVPTPTPRPKADEGPESQRDPTAPAGPPKLPDLSGVVSPILRCDKIVAWIAEATGAAEVFLADGAGLPLAGAIHETEARLAGSGLVATSISSLAAAIPGNASQLFELHIGEGPFFQLIGFQAGAAVYVVGLTRPTPLTPRQAHAIRLACRHALGETLGGRP